MRHIAYAVGLATSRSGALWPSNLAGYALQGGNTAEARRRLDESLELARLIDDTRGTGQALASTARSNCSKANLEHAFSCFEEAATVARRLGARWLGGEAIWGFGFAHVAAAGGDADRAAHLAGAALAFGASAGFDPRVTTPFTPHLDDARAALGEQAWQKGPGRGRGARPRCRAPARARSLGMGRRRRQESVPRLRARGIEQRDPNYLCRSGDSAADCASVRQCTLTRLSSCRD